MKRLGTALVILLAAGIACAPTRKSSRGFRLPDGDPQRGRQVFADLRCHACHQVAGEAFPAPVADPPVNVVLGGLVPSPRTDGDLVTSIVNPSHRIAPWMGEVRAGGLSRMGDFGDHLTVHELVDLVAFLQGRYEVRPPSVANGMP